MIRKIAWKNIVHKPLNSTLCVSLLLFGVGIISLILLIQHQLEHKFEKDLHNIDLVVGAKGSPLQLVLSAVYHLDAPTGNIRLAEAKKIMNEPMVETAIPLAYGDSYRGFRILGTTTAYLEKYNAKFKEGRAFENAMEISIGAKVAEKTGFQVGDIFLGTHGEAKEGHVHEDQPYEVVGILHETNTVLDHILLTNIESIWQVHSPNSHHNETDSDHDHSHAHLENTAHDEEKDITALLLKCKTKLAILNMPRIINEKTNMQAVIPSLEINRLLYMLGLGATTLKLIAGSIMILASFTVFFVLYNRLRERKYELALMRSVGYRPRSLFSLLLLEGFLLAVLGYVLGWLLSRLGLYFINHQAENDFNFQFGMQYVDGEGWLLLLTLLLGIVAALLPAWQAMRTDVSSTLSAK